MANIADKVTLYLNTDEFELKKRGETFLLYANGEKKESIPALKVKDIVISGNISLCNDVLDLCKKEKINIHFISRNGKHYGSVHFDPSKNLFVRLEQIRCHLDEHKSNEIAGKFIKAKIKNQKWFLNTFNDKKIVFEEAIIDDSIDFQILLGIEGSKTKEYFNYWDDYLIKNPDFKFDKRTRRPPENEVNALLSLCYMLLASEIHTLCNIVSLDPYFGFLHKNYYGRPSLVCDLIEPYRPFVDKFVLNLINRKEISNECFKKNPNDIEYELTKDGFSLLITKWTKYYKYKDFYYGILGKEIPLNKLIETDIRLFAKYLISEIEDFTPYVME